MSPLSSLPSPDALEALRAHLLEGSERCLRPPVDRFAHRWLAPMPLTERGAAYLAARHGSALEGADSAALARPGSGDGFRSGDYSLGLFHHDASEASIELLRHPNLREAAAGSLLCLLDCADPNGRIHRAELSHKAREAEPSKPVMAQYALRVGDALGMEWLERHRVLPRVLAFIAYLEREYVGLHGLFLTHSALQSGFDSDLLTATLPDRAVEGPDTNAFMVLEYEAAAELCRRTGADRDAEQFAEKAEQLRKRMNALLWYEDARGGFYVGLRWQHGVGSLEAERVGVRSSGVDEPLDTWVSFLPLYAGIPSPERAKAMLRRLLDPKAYWGPSGIRTLPADSLFFTQSPRVMLYDHKKKDRGPVSNWSGPIWVLSNYYLAVGLARYGARDAAQELTVRTAKLLSQNFSTRGALFECYDDAGRGLWPRAGTFISWNVLVLTLLERFVSTGA